MTIQARSSAVRIVLDGTGHLVRPFDSLRYVILRRRSARQHPARPASAPMTARLPVIRDASTLTTSPYRPDAVPALIAAAGERAARRFLEFLRA
jgi:hypothetical protein